MLLTRSASFLRRSLALLIASLLLVTSAPQAWGADSKLVRIEEDWELVVDNPDVNSFGPQVACAFSPFADLNHLYVTFEVNHRGAPVTSGGGLHLQVWHDDEHVESKAFPDRSVLATPGEVVRWTQRMQVQSGKIVFEVVNGQSSTWGEFGNRGTLKAEVECDVDNLNGYSPQVSIDNSGTTFGSHRIRLLILKSVRAVREDGTVQSVQLNHIVHQNDTED